MAPQGTATGTHSPRDEAVPVRRPPHRPRRAGPARTRRLLVTVLLGLALVVPTARAEAYSGASFPVVSSGNRGADVQAVQYLLQSHGFSTAADGAFGAGTTATVQAFQRSRGLAADGVVGSTTWGRLVVTLRSGSSGAAVRALQVELNEKRNVGLAVDGQFGSGTQNAVRSFQSHAGIAPDGVVGPTTWKNLLWHYGYPSFTNLCDQNPDGNASANWGAASTVAQVEAAAASFAATGQGRVPLGDISLERGGDIAGHASHETGLDVDLWPIRTDSAQCTSGRITWGSSLYDRTATRSLVRAIRDRAPGQVALIYFNDPTLISEGLTTQYPNHDNHLHVRYR